jgi:L-alanine-DL-glutamate epimerase-like enolase superfamily enzyme
VRITGVEIRACSPSLRSDAAMGAVEGAELRGGTAPDVVVISLTTDDGITGVSFGSGGLDARTTARAFAQVQPFFLGRNPMAREQNAQEFRWFDRRWNHSPIYAYGPFDIACWDIAGQRAGLPVHELIGTAADRRAVYVSSMFLSTPAEYVAQAVEVKARGLRGYKVHPPSPAAVDVEVYTAVREAVGPDFPLMADPVATHSYEEALRVGRVLEQLGYLWFEEPFYDYDVHSYVRLRQKLDIPIAGTETIAGGSQLTAQFIASGAVDIVRTDPSWRGGITGAPRAGEPAHRPGDEQHRVVRAALPAGGLRLRAGRAARPARRLRLRAAGTGSGRRLRLGRHRRRHGRVHLAEWV